ncbi:hypothetical protein GJW-30_1_01693 [Variibacter gotjawalensis]|uniref:Thioredoxin-like fold domain-containing protein n=1 Tax=Variibacter gotjawalensis TaxID=1333996 RepID=A0A0S3PTA9_9BRAD|nr:thioredoxin family protein [Variibacter gotjawalensis]NIK49478.1 thioredoxin-related protein [Variibacter gotjawalensis]RZS51330.1 thioredoxin-related protein [Variibacter gotjawalensis]BAT59163.1 hypothetical protein GJW-30_1_01693 [Variibacter gotjawalensis]
MPTRRLILAAAASAVLVRPARAELVRLDGGNFTQSWFVDTFLELGSDVAEATQKGKRLAIMWDLNGCPYCRRTHTEGFADDSVASFVRERFDVMQLNLQGSREVTDLDGEKLTEKRFAAKYGVRFAPTFQFFPETTEGLAAKKPAAREAARAEGYFEPLRLKRVFAFVAEKAYAKQSLNDYLGTPNAAPTGSQTQ